jgi:hypothetical protein
MLLHQLLTASQVPDSLPSSLLGRKLRTSPQPGSKEEKNIDANTATDSQARKQRNSPIHPKVQKHWVAKVNRPTRQCRPRKIIPREQTRRILRIHQGQIQKDALDNEENTNRRDDDTDTTHNPMNILSRRPPKDEQTDRDEEGYGQSGNKTSLRTAEPVEADGGLHAVENVPPVPHHCEHDANSDGQECEPELPKIEMIHAFVYERERFEETVENAVDNRCVDCCKSDTGVQEHELKWPPERLNRYIPRCHFRLVDFALCAQSLVAGEFAQALGAAEENGCRRRFWKEEEEGQEDGAVHPEHFPLRPAPVFRRDAEAADNGAEGGAAGCSKGPQGEHVGQLYQREDVLQGCAAGGETRATEETLEEAEGD